MLIHFDPAMKPTARKENSFHILNGDHLAASLKAAGIPGIPLICRESLLEGPLYATNLNDFWQLRANYHAQRQLEDAPAYLKHSVTEFEKIIHIPAGAEVNLWFGNDLFCQVNLWFIVSLLSHRSDLRLYRVFPNPVDQFGTCKGFESLSPEAAIRLLQSKTELHESDVQLAAALWQATAQHNLEALNRLSAVETPAFPFLQSVCKAHTDRFPENNLLSRPQRVMQEILEKKQLDFWTAFHEFAQREPIYGFGDLQLRPIYDQVVKQSDYS